MLRKVIAIITISAVCLLMAGCHLKEKIGENITEKAVEKAAGNGSDVDIDNGDVSIKSKDGEEVKVNDDGITINGKDGSVVQSGGEYEWPEGQAAAYVPKFKGGKITYILNSAESFLVYVEETKLDDFNDYVKAVAEKGYTEDKVESSAEDLQLYSAKSTDGVTVTVSYVNSEKLLSITAEVSKVQ